MLLRRDIDLTASELNNLFQSQHDASAMGKAEEALVSHLITGYEEAIALGMQPTEALQHMLRWVASEMGRITIGPQPKHDSTSESV